MYDTFFPVLLAMIHNKCSNSFMVFSITDISAAGVRRKKLWGKYKDVIRKP